MKELEYPFDSQYILQNKRKLKKHLIGERDEWIEKKIAIFAGSTVSDIRQIIELFLLNQGIKASFYESDYNKYYEDALFSNPELDSFKPDIVYVYTGYRNVSSFPKLSDSSSQIDEMLENEVAKYIAMWSAITNRFHCPIIQNNFELPLFRLMGNRDAYDIHGAINYVTRLNMEFYQYAQTHEDFFICDINYISADYGLKEWQDPFYWYMYKYALNFNAIPCLSFNVSNIIKSIFGKNKKGFALDLDNTLWGGIVGEDGPANLKIGPEEPIGQVYSEFQTYLKANKQLGVVLCINSKNDEDNALSGLNNENNILKPDDFLIIKANWNTKDMNMSEIAKELNVLPESLVFIDDNPAERQIVTDQIPGVQAPKIGEAHHYLQVIDRSGFFETTYLTQDDLQRNEMYEKNVSRLKLQASYTDYGEYLDSLEMKATIKKFAPEYLERITQLTNKSNQFNLTTRRYTMAELESISLNDNYVALCGRLKDRFGDNGIVAVSIGEIEDNVCHIVLWLMSCRVLKRDMEYAMMDEFIKNCQKKNVKELRGYYYPTSKNGQVKEFYRTMGFNLLSEDDSGNTTWQYIIPASYINCNTHISMEE